MLLVSHVAMVRFYVRCTRSLRQNQQRHTALVSASSRHSTSSCRGNVFIVGLTKTRHPAFKDLIEQLALEMNDGEVPTKEAAKERRAAMMAEKA